jgi:O-antigen ligase
MEAHNVYIEILFESGFLGLSTFVGIWLSLVTFYLKRLRQEFASLHWEYSLSIGYVISYMVMCIADNMNYYLMYSWFFIGLMVASARKLPADHDEISAELS